MAGRQPCRAESCAGGRGTRAAVGGFLCPPCKARLATDLAALPALHADCAGGGGPAVIRQIRKVPRKASGTGSMNLAAAEVRAAVRTVLASWAGLVAEERRLVAPTRDLPELAHFLGRHLDWLVRHPAAGDLADEVRELSRAARAIAYPRDVRRIRLGSCPGDGCDGNLVARVDPGADLPAEIVCTASADHSWPVAWWSELAHRLRVGGGRR